ncbi:MAG: hypothetical protein SF097_27185 [Acidobacteriota bacterium]|nr:hypothetical protein [Acidobacteriota bacterium]
MFIGAEEKRAKHSPAIKTQQGNSFCCEACGQNGHRNIGMVSAERAANICQCSRLKIYRWIDEGDLHYVELPDGAVLVCGKTLAQKIEELSLTTDKLSSH